MVIGTPGRILDMMNEQALKVHTAFAFVVDEADMTLDMGFSRSRSNCRSFARKLQMLVFLQPFQKNYDHF